MLTQADRANERRRVKLEEIQRQVKDGSLRIRKMTPEERRRYPALPAKARRRYRIGRSVRRGCLQRVARAFDARGWLSSPVATDLQAELSLRRTGPGDR